MTYQYQCKKCSHEFELVNIPMANREDATKKPCPECGAKEVGTVMTAAAISTRGAKSVYQRAGNGWKDVQNKIKQHVGRNHTIRTK